MPDQNEKRRPGRPTAGTWRAADDAGAGSTGGLDVRWAWGLGSAVLIVVGSLGTWVTAGPFSLSGTSGGRDGTITLVIALVAAGLIALRRWPLLVGLLAFAVLVTGVVDTANVSSTRVPVFLNASVGWGLIVVDIAAASLLCWSFATEGQRRYVTRRRSS